MIKILPISLVAAASVCLLGCDSSTQTPVDNVPADNAAEAPSTPAPGEMTTTASGLKYQVLNKGTGTKSPKATDTVKVHYHGTLLNGTVFDSSVQRNEPISFPLNGVIPCWTEGLQKMKVGGKAKLVCPADTAYGDRGSGPIPGGAALVFEVELLGIEGQ